MVDGEIHGVLTGGAFEIGGWAVEPARNRLSRGEDSVHLEPRAMDLLLCLVEHRGQVVPRRLIVDRVWAGGFIADTTLTHTIADLRRAFGDDPRSPSFIETIPKRGYRLVAEVTIPDPAPGGPESAAGTEPRPFAVIVADRVVLGDRAVAFTSDRFLICHGSEIPLIPPKVVFGRTRDVEIQILAPEISRRHARIDLGPAGAVLADLGSKNGTVVNQRPVTAPVTLAPGDTINLGPATMVFCAGSDEPTRTQADS